MSDMHTAIPCTGSTADQADSTIHVQLGAAKHLTRPLTTCLLPVIHAVYCQSSYTQNGTGAAQQGKRKADRWKKDYERRREEHKTLLSFPSPNLLIIIGC